MIKTSVQQYLPYTILFIALHSILKWAPPPFSNTYLWWLISLTVLFIYFWEAGFSFVRLEDKRAIFIAKLLLIWNIVCIGRGVFMAENYWHYKFLVGSGMALLIPVTAYIALNNQSAQNILSYYVRIVLPVAILILPFFSPAGWGWYFFPITLLILFYPELPLKGKIIGVFITLICIFADIQSRSFVIKYSVPLILLLFYYTRHFIATVKVFKVVRLILMVIPFAFFSLAVANIFNVFNMHEYIKTDIKVENTDGKPSYATDIKKDTRTFLYVEALNTAAKYNSWILGRTPARGSETVWFAKEMIEFYGSPERPRSEVGILNTFTWTGIIGVVLTFLVFYKASYFAINRSNNFYAKLIGLYVAFRWAYGWVEDLQAIDANNFTLWLMIGLCFSSSFREMTNFEIKIWLLGIYKKEYSWFYNYYVKRNTIAKV